MMELRKYINDVLGGIGTPRNDYERGKVEAYCDILSRLKRKEDGAKGRRSVREVFDSGVSGMPDVRP